MCPDTSRAQSTLCEYPDCNKPVWQDPDGSYSSYCGNSHRLAMAQQGHTTQCKNCHSRPAYVENGYTHPFCGRQCATAFKTGQQSQVTQASTASGSPGPNNATHICKLAGCRAPVFVGADGVPSQYCTLTHRREAVKTGKAEACMQCLEVPKIVINGKESDFCSRRCRDFVYGSAPVILEVRKGHKAFQNVESQFHEGWKHPTQAPSVLKIWKIFGDKQSADKFEQYKLAVERRTGQASGNARRRWHGTVRECKLGDDDSNRGLCNQQGCRLCGIIKTSFQLVQAGSRTNFGRFGAGIYASATSSKANDYVSEKRSRYKCMLLNNMVLGRTIKLTTTDESLTEPPPGYDAVIGEPGGDLNYDESIVYTNDAIRPLFLVIYE